MLLPSEIEAKITIPILRAMIVRKLTANHGYTQERAAKALGVTQAAVSNYLRGVRGNLVRLESNDEIMSAADEVVQLIINGGSMLEINKKFYEGVEKLRKCRVLCGVHKQLEPWLDVDSCDICE